MKKNIGIFLVMCIMLTAYKNDKFPYDDELDDSEKNEISTEYDSLIDRKIANTKDEKINIGYDEALSEYEGYLDNVKLFEEDYKNQDYDGDGKTDRMVGRFCCVQQEKAITERMRRRAEIDVLTNVYNHKAFEEYCAKELAECTTNALFVMLDIDDFKNVNDSRGHAFGDTVLCELTANLERSFRSSDLLGRIGGDEFAVLMCDITSIENALVKAGQICSLYTKGAAKEGLKISCSIGMVFCESDDGAAFDDLYQKADSALYKAKGKGKNVFVVFDENML